MFLIKKGATAAGGDREIILPPRRGFPKWLRYVCTTVRLFSQFSCTLPAIFIATHSLLLDFFFVLSSVHDDDFFS